MASVDSVISNLTSLEKQVISSIVDVAITFVYKQNRRLTQTYNFLTRRRSRVANLIAKISDSHESQNIENKYNSFRTIFSTIYSDSEELDDLLNYAAILISPELSKSYEYNREYSDVTKYIENLAVYIDDFGSLKTDLEELKSKLS